MKRRTKKVYEFLDPLQEIRNDISRGKNMKGKGIQKVPLEGIKRGDTVLEIRGITKRFPGVIANDNIDLDLKAGEIHAILGENGAGKTTLMNIIYGLLKPDEGEIYVHGKKVEFKSPLDAIDQGIGMVHQHRMLIPSHTIIENIIIGHPETKAIIDIKKAALRVKELCKKYGFKLDLGSKVWQLSAEEKQMVEILKSLYRGAKLLILDEPTSVLTPTETEKLMQSLKIIAKNELSVIPFITHKLPVVLEFSDRVTVLRRGKVVDRLITKDATTRTLARSMLGRDVAFKVKKVHVKKGREILKIEDLSAFNDKGVLALQGLSFSLHEGEIFGIAGISGNGQQELAEVLIGLRKSESGKIFFIDKNITYSSILKRWKMGIGYIPSDRVGVGSVGDFSLVDNVALNFYFDPEFSRHGIIDYKKIRKHTEKIISEYGVAYPDVDCQAKNLSGGNIQKLILARVVSRKPRLLIANSPTHGLDVGSVEFVCNELQQLKKNKAGIVFISEDLDEVLAMSDRIAPIYEGKFVAIIPAEEAKREDIGAMMTGVHLKV